MKPIISIVVPIYNMEAYLPRCLDSLLAQTYPLFEIITVNDGSTDGSLAVLKRYAAADTRVQIIDSVNRGVAAARNLGLASCRGEYIGFVDPDDWVDREMYGEMHAAALEHNADIVMCAYTREFGTHANPKPFPLPDMTFLRGDEVQSGMTRRLIGPIGAETASPEHLDAWGTVWSKLYRSELLKESGIAFEDLSVIGSNEDTLFNVAAFRKASSFLFLNRPYYHYWRANEDSITTRHKPDHLKRFLVQYEKLEEAFGDCPNDAEYRKALSNRVALNVMGLGLNIISHSNPASLKGKLDQIKGLLSQPRMKAALAEFDASASPLVWKLFFTAARLRLALPLYFMLNGIELLRTKKKGRNIRGADSHPAGRDHHEPGRTGNDAHELLPANE
ncbi:glycosyltransferase [Paenibacillus sp. 1011MAR3C5]|uniref:glycosyltransferase family 2 protein n=1 Tax=Paenibacillus sp. 1011MAR3C5 TaxID=1675787 RepID=UPI000E6C0355|nr:glycosyltransferase [Paenibacillus sp. 1011MAR3C5]RJE91161.1 glycosyltransferase [Paenibacillus sp. 1011MAR3C5]